MIQRNLMERFCIYWWVDDDELGEFGTEWVQQLAELIGWPVSIETDNVEIRSGGGA